MASKGKTPQEKGADFEAACQDWMTVWQSSKKFWYHRLYDTKSAGFYLPPQPGDFLMGYQGNVVVLECKSSERYHTLAERRTPVTELFGVEQLTQMKLAARAGLSTAVIFQAQQTNDIEIWNGEYVRDMFVSEFRDDVLDSEYRIPFTIEEYKTKKAAIEHALWYIVTQGVSRP